MARTLDTTHNAKGTKQATDLSNEYSRKNLSFDSDALSAIVGALNTLADARPANLHHWAIPFCQYQRNPSDVNSLLSSPSDHDENSLTNWAFVAMGLIWYLEQPSSRRGGFPSWSVLGWKGSIHWGTGEFYTLSPPQFACFESSPRSYDAPSPQDLLTCAFVRNKISGVEFGIHAMTVPSHRTTFERLKSQAFQSSGVYFSGHNYIALPYNSTSELLVKPS
ncbi:hypothetical protein EK21DRAFT_83697 [Setomelanomma holmii]|uniref:Uncharacterized protein n=1 Tax=Setomelanomma holmii TaxID=210430 RepID=A0A9P4LVI6_9PLEO|nr:hypothetical protein EK21DRAFT_83697 [Setomelanomma holmii]